LWLPYAVSGIMIGVVFFQACWYERHLCLGGRRANDDGDDAIRESLVDSEDGIAGKKW
jgi:hypothetical protein